jgi:hypothetical protein
MMMMMMMIQAELLTASLNKLQKNKQSHFVVINFGQFIKQASNFMDVFVHFRPAFPKLVSREKFLKCDFFNYIRIKNHKNWESEKNKRKLGKGTK